MYVCHLLYIFYTSQLNLKFQSSVSLEIEHGTHMGTTACVDKMGCISQVVVYKYYFKTSVHQLSASLIWSYSHVVLKTLA